MSNTEREDSNAAIKDILQSKAVTHEIKHVRDQLVKEDKESWQNTMDKWIVIINDQSFEYYTGIGHREYDTKAMHRGGNPAAYNWTKKDFDHLRNKNLTENGFKSFLFFSKPKTPDILDALYGLVMDSDALESSFKDWCCDLGYDHDSIKAKKIYEACQENAFKLKNMGLDLG